MPQNLSSRALTSEERPMNVFDVGGSRECLNQDGKKGNISYSFFYIIKFRIYESFKRKYVIFLPKEHVATIIQSPSMIVFPLKLHVSNYDKEIIFVHHSQHSRDQIFKLITWTPLKVILI